MSKLVLAKKSVFFHLKVLVLLLFNEDPLVDVVGRIELLDDDSYKVVYSDSPH